MRTEEQPRVPRSSLAATAGRVMGLAGSMFLVILAAGALLLVAVKLQFPSLGSGADPFDVLRSLGLLGFACLGVPVHFEGLDVTALPLGLLGVIALVSIRMSRDLFVRTPGSGTSEIAWTAVALGALGVVGSFLFRFSGAEPVGTSASFAGLICGAWGAAFAALGWRWARPRVEVPDAPRHETVWGGLKTARILGGLGAWGSALGLLALIAGRLLTEPLPRSFSLADATAATIYVMAFLPNLLAAVFSLGAGATLEIGAQIDVGGRVVGPLREISLLGDGPVALWFLALVPLSVGVLGGALSLSSGRAKVAKLALGAGVFALGVGVVAWVGDARLGAGLVKEQGVGLVAVQAFPAALLSFGWIFLGGLLGMAFVERMKGRNT